MRCSMYLQQTEPDRGSEKAHNICIVVFPLKTRAFHIFWQREEEWEYV